VSFFWLRSVGLNEIVVGIPPFFKQDLYESYTHVIVFLNDILGSRRTAIKDKTFRIIRNKSAPFFF
jgi:hypothetical protein